MFIFRFGNRSNQLVGRFLKVGMNGTNKIFFLNYVNLLHYTNIFTLHDEIPSPKHTLKLEISKYVLFSQSPLEILCTNNEKCEPEG
jgi:hypothetical protein